MAVFRPSAGSTLGAFALGSFLVLAAPAMARAKEIIRETAEGITLLSTAASSSDPLREVPGKREALSRIEVALEVLRTGSPGSFEAMANLGGRIVIEYDPDEASLDALGGPLAVFRSHTGVRKLDQTGDPLYVAVLGARAVLWPAEDLAGIIVHEILGHGRQHVEGRLRTMNQKDRECEARLYQMRTYQDLGVAPVRGTITAFRQSLEAIWCEAFLIHLRSTWPAAGDLWTAASGDPGRVFESFKAYRRIAHGGQMGGPHLAAEAATGGKPDAVSLDGAQSLVAYARRLLQKDS